VGVGVGVVGAPSQCCEVVGGSKMNILGDNIDFVPSKFLKLSNQIKRNSKNHSDFIIRWYRVVE